MTFEHAARAQYLRSSYYTVWLHGPNGEKELLAHTQRKSGSGLLAVLYRPSVQERVKQLPGAESARLQKFKDRLELSNGWTIRIGGTIRQEAESKGVS